MSLTAFKKWLYLCSARDGASSLLRVSGVVTVTAVRSRASFVKCPLVGDRPLSSAEGASRPPR